MIAARLWKFGDDITALFDWMDTFEANWVPKWIDTRSVHA